MDVLINIDAQTAGCLHSVGGDTPMNEWVGGCAASHHSLAQHLQRHTYTYALMLVDPLFWKLFVTPLSSRPFYTAAFPPSTDYVQDSSKTLLQSSSKEVVCVLWTRVWATRAVAP